LSNGPAKTLRLRILLYPALFALLLCAAPRCLYAGATFTSRTTLLPNRAYADALLSGIRGARASIVCSFYLFKTGEGSDNLPHRIAEELVRARKRGVTVTVFLEKGGRDGNTLDADNRRTASFLAQGGVRVNFDSPRVTTHNKVVVIDSRHVYLGSHNLTQAALSRNRELSVLIDSPGIASEVLSSLERD
jgi:phosphatidylserine/phosphatidylglycerophosphate/cardiolipin synthase-like enzyme